MLGSTSSVPQPQEFADYRHTSSTHEALETDGDLDAEEYLAFARLDMAEPESVRTRVNALSNAKRAIHFQVDLLARALGGDHLHKGKISPFPPKLDFCSKCGVVGPRVLKKLNKVRNAVEHDYYSPTQEEIEDFIDVAELFVAATMPLVKSFPTMVELSTDAGHLFDVPMKRLRLEVEPGSGLLRIETTEFDGSEAELRQAAEQILTGFKDQGEDGVHVIHVMGKEMLAYSSAFKRRRKNASYVVSIDTFDLYCRWFSFLVVGAA